MKRHDYDLPKQDLLDSLLVRPRICDTWRSLIHSILFHFRISIGCFFYSFFPISWKYGWTKRQTQLEEERTKSEPALIQTICSVASYTNICGLQSHTQDLTKKGLFLRKRSPPGHYILEEFLFWSSEWWMVKLPIKCMFLYLLQTPL